MAFGADKLQSGEGAVGGRRVGPYEVSSLLGRGATAQVFLARRPGIERAFALKLLAAGLAPDLVARTRRGAELASRLVHSRIVSPVDIGVHQGCLYLVYEHVPGPTLAERLRAGPLPWREATQVVCDIAVAVEAAHRGGVVHRDLKPSNVILDARDGKPKVTDFGLARAVAGGSDLSRTGDLLGTPVYMAPEQVRGEAADVRADVYALGVLLHELVEGRPPFGGRDLQELCRAIVKGRAPAMQALVPPALQAVCRQAMAVAPTARPASAGVLAEQLQVVLTEIPESWETSLARRDSLLGSATSSWSGARPRVLVPLATLWVLTLTGLTGWGAWEHQQRVRERTEAEAARAGLERDLADGERRLSEREAWSAALEARLAAAARERDEVTGELERVSAQQRALEARRDELALRVRALEEQTEAALATAAGGVPAAQLVDALVDELARLDGPRALALRARLLVGRARYAECLALPGARDGGAPPDDPWWAVTIARAEARGGDPAAAAQAFERIAREDPDGAPGLFARAATADAGFEQRVSLLQRAAALDPDAECVHTFLAKVLHAEAVGRGSHELAREARAVAEEAVRLAPYAFQPYFERSYTAYAAFILSGGRDREQGGPAIADLERARALHPDPYLWFLTGKSNLEMLARPRAALVEFEEALRRMGAEGDLSVRVQVLTFMGVARLELGDEEGALAAWFQLVRVTGGRIPHQLRDLMGRAAAKGSSGFQERVRRILEGRGRR